MKGERSFDDGGIAISMKGGGSQAPNDTQCIALPFSGEGHRTNRASPLLLVPCIHCHLASARVEWNIGAQGEYQIKKALFSSS